MVIPRKRLISLDATSSYPCVRRAFQCGEDHYSGHNCEHRRQWFADRSEELTPVFAIDLCAYAVLSNH